MAKVTTVQQAREITELNHRTNELSDAIEALKVPKKKSPFMSRFSISDLRAGYGPQEARYLVYNLDEEDFADINRFIVNKAKRRLKLNREKLAEMGIKPEE